MLVSMPRTVGKVNEQSFFHEFILESLCVTQDDNPHCKCSLIPFVAYVLKSGSYLRNTMPSMFPLVCSMSLVLVRFFCVIDVLLNKDLLHSPQGP